MAIETVKKHYEEEVDVVIVVGTRPGGSTGRFVAARYENGLLKSNSDGGANSGPDWWRRNAQNEVVTNEREPGTNCFKVIYVDKDDIRYTDQVNATITDLNHPKGPRYGFPDKLSELFPPEQPKTDVDAPQRTADTKVNSRTSGRKKTA